MTLRVLTLLFATILPGLAAVGVSGYYVLVDWAALEQLCCAKGVQAHQNYTKLAETGAGLRELSIAEVAEMRHRINCFAEGVGVLLGGVIVSVGVHGLCGLPKRE
jgi:hypothetical protein